MTRRDLSKEPDDALDELILAARAELDASLEHELREFGPDFAAVVEAAHARDPNKVPRAALAEALALAPVVVLGAESSQRISVRGQSEFSALLAEARGEIASDAAARRPHAWPSDPVPKASPAWPSDPVPKASPAEGSRTRRWLWATAAAAAAAILAVASPMLATRHQTTHDAASQAPWWQHAGGSAGVAPFREPVEIVAPQDRPRRPTLADPPAPPEPAPTPTNNEPEPEPPETQGPAPTPVPKTRKPPEPPAPESLTDQLRRLAAEAESAWQSGDYAGAERLHRQVIALAPSSRAADLSYGDLFTLARQRSGPAQEQALWREYLAAFPRGRYADDARAGLCRRADADARAACWQHYLTDFPAGVHRLQAERALAEP